MKKYDMGGFNRIVRMAAEHRESIITASLVLYLGAYLLVGVAGIGFGA